ncbi:hypothetical protein [Nocardia pseudovaccinii]|uniref:hypothetical protein n=1 Tax=Nocardia pseudovaccinii TaxID=189540 RepID=UPI0012F4B8EB|nr:hypothetical protein [Nocardia pseudovaccinii]
MALKPLTIKLPEHFLTVAREVAEAEDTTLSAWAAKAVTEKLLRLAAQAETEWDRAHPEETAAAFAEREAEYEARRQAEDAEDAAAQRHGDAA